MEPTKKVRIVCISDTHTYHDQITLPEGDILIHAGDATFRGNKTEVTDFGRWFRAQDFKYKIFVAGNHDLGFENNPEFTRRLLLKGYSNKDDKGQTKYLQDSGTELNINGINLKIWGSPWTPYFCDWAFNLRTEEELKSKWDLIPKDTDIFICHGPAMDCLDKSIQRGRPLGSYSLKQWLIENQPKLFVCGHIHESRGTMELGETRIVNAGICTRAYDATNKPFVIDYDGHTMWVIEE